VQKSHETARSAVLVLGSGIAGLARDEKSFPCSSYHSGRSEADMFYNFCRLHKTLRVTSAMAAGVTDRLWEVADIAAMLDARDLAIATGRTPIGTPLN
jgi:hypothetical protein